MGNYGYLNIIGKRSEKREKGKFIGFLGVPFDIRGFLAKGEIQPRCFE